MRERRHRRSPLHYLYACLTASIVAGLTAACSTSHPVKAPTLGADVHAVTLTEVQQSIDDIYSTTPAIAHYSAQQVQYTAKARDKVFGVCSDGAAASDEDALQSAKVMACAPLIYFFYSYGNAAHSSAAYHVADNIYDYAVTSITGPFNTQSTLNGLLRTWGISVAARGNSTGTGLSGTAALEASLVAAARKAMNAATGVRLTVAATSTSTSGAKASTQHAVLDAGTSTAVEALASGAAHGYLRVLPQAAYFSGDAAGLTTFFGMSVKSAQHVATRWVSMKAGTSQYTSFADGSLAASLPSTILPATDSVTVTSTTSQGVAVYRLNWTTFGTSGTDKIARTLDLAATGTHLPIAETSIAGNGKQTVTFTRWGETVTSRAPANTVPFATASVSK